MTFTLKIEQFFQTQAIQSIFFQGLFDQKNEETLEFMIRLKLHFQ